MLTNKNNGTTDSLLLSDVKSISFKSDSSKLSHTKILISKNNGTIDSLWFSDVKSISFKSVSSISNDMVQVAGGTFTAGSTLVTISNFKIDKYEVTYELWTDVRNWGLNNGYTDLPVGSNGFNPVGSNNSVTRVKWYDIVKWCNARSQKDGQTPVYYTDNTQSMVYRIGQIDINIDAVKWNANGYRLPTEAEWEFAARGGTISQGYTYSGSSTVDNVAWYDSNSGNTTHTVGTKSANELGIYDMSGNVWEWCWDWHGSAYPSGGTSDPRGPSTTQSYRMLRGGSFYSNEYHCRVDLRLNDFPDVRYTDPDDYGFRCVHN
jgi:formylglycine-generating enzyme required for sulfatase activity